MSNKFSFKTQTELEGYLKNKMEDAMDEAYEKLRKHLVKIIKKDIYDSYDPKFYFRGITDEWLADEDNWIIERKRGTKYITRELTLDESAYMQPDEDYIFRTDGMNFSTRPFIHGHPNKSGGVDTFDLDKFLNMLNGGTSGNAFNFPMITRQPFWDDFLTYAKRYYPILFKNACKRNGIDLK